MNTEEEAMRELHASPGHGRQLAGLFVSIFIGLGLATLFAFGTVFGAKKGWNRA